MRWYVAVLTVMMALAPAMVAAQEVAAPETDVPVVASDLPGIAGIVRETGCGVLCDPTSPAAIAAAIRAILDAPAPERAAFRDRASAAAHGQYSWEAQVEILLAEYGRLTGRPW